MVAKVLQVRVSEACVVPHKGTCGDVEARGGPRAEVAMIERKPQIVWNFFFVFCTVQLIDF